MTDIEQAIEKELGFRVRTTPEGDFVDYSFGGTSPTVSESVTLWQSLLSARRETQELAAGILKQAEELKYIDGIVVKGTGKPMQPDDTYRDRILNYVKSLDSRPESELVKAVEEFLNECSQPDGDPRVKYEEVQITRGALAELRARIAQLKGTER